MRGKETPNGFQMMEAFVVGLFLGLIQFSTHRGSIYLILVTSCDKPECLINLHRFLATENFLKYPPKDLLLDNLFHLAEVKPSFSFFPFHIKPNDFFLIFSRVLVGIYSMESQQNGMDSITILIRSRNFRETTNGYTNL
jgi:hypothetical protein